MILSAQTIAELCSYEGGLVSPFYNTQQIHESKLTWGLGPAGYDIRCREPLYIPTGRMGLVSSLERMVIPNGILAVVHDKSSLSRMGVVVQNTILEPGWEGYLTLEVSYHGKQAGFSISGGQPIAQLVFHLLDKPTEMPYRGKYQNQPPRPVKGKDDQW